MLDFCTGDRNAYGKNWSKWAARAKRFVSGSFDNTVKVWDACTGQAIRTLKRHTDTVNAVAISSDGKRIVSGSADETVKVWGAATNHEILTLRGHTDYVRGVAISVDGKRIVSVSNDRTIKVWDATNFLAGLPIPTAYFAESSKLTVRDPRDRVRTSCFHKTHTLKLNAGKTYTIDLIGDFDTFLRLEDKNGKQLAFDDGRQKLNSRLIFRPSQSGNYRLIVTSFGSGATGTYRLLVWQH